MSATPTIFALSSGAPPAGIGVIRLSGPEAGAALAALTGRVPQPRRASLAKLRDNAGALLDEALVLSTVDYGEADRVVTLFTRERGRL